MAAYNYSDPSEKLITTTTDNDEYFDVCTDTLKPGRPLRTVPVAVPSVISKGDHVLFLINSDDVYRPVYRSALVESVSSYGEVEMISYTPQGVQRQTQKFHTFKSLHKVDYTTDAYDGVIAVKKARQRLGECHYHGLFNNSHHFVSWAKTGLEYSLADLVHGIEGKLDITKSKGQATSKKCLVSSNQSVSSQKELVS